LSSDELNIETETKQSFDPMFFVNIGFNEPGYSVFILDQRGSEKFTKKLLKRRKNEPAFFKIFKIEENQKSLFQHFFQTSNP